MPRAFTRPTHPYLGLTVTVGTGLMQLVSNISVSRDATRFGMNKRIGQAEDKRISALQHI